jgi:hypothetical protein
MVWYPLILGWVSDQVVVVVVVGSGNKLLIILTIS